MKNKILISTLVLVVIIFLSGCTQAPQPPAGGGEKEIIFETISKGESSGYMEKVNLVINDEKTFRETWDKTFSIQTLPPKAVIDFSKETVIAVFMGEKNTGGYSVSIEKIISSGDKVTVLVKEVAPPPDAFVTLALTQPYHIVKTSKITKTVEFQKVE